MSEVRHRRGREDAHSRHYISILKTRLASAEKSVSELRQDQASAVSRARAEGRAEAEARLCSLRTRSLDSQRRSLTATITSLRHQHAQDLHRLTLAKDTELRTLAAHLRKTSHSVPPNHTPSPTPSTSSTPRPPSERQLKAQILELQSRLAVEVGRGRAAETELRAAGDRESLALSQADSALRELKKKELQLAQFSERLDNIHPRTTDPCRGPLLDEEPEFAEGLIESGSEEEMLKRRTQSVSREEFEREKARWTARLEERSSALRTAEENAAALTQAKAALNRQIVELKKSQRPLNEANRRLGEKQRVAQTKTSELQDRLSQAEDQLQALSSRNEELMGELARSREEEPRILAGLQQAAMEKDRKIELLHQKLRRLRKAKPMRLSLDEDLSASMSLDTIDEDLEEISTGQLQDNYRTLANEHLQLQAAFTAFKEENRKRKREEQLERQLEAALGRLAALQLQSSMSEGVQHSASMPSIRPSDPRVPALEQALRELQDSRDSLSRELCDLKETNELLEFQVLELQQQQGDEEGSAKVELVGVSEDEGVASGADLTEASSAEDSARQLTVEELRLRLTLLKHRPGLRETDRSVVAQVRGYLEWLESEHGVCKRREMELELRHREREAALRTQLSQLTASSPTEDMAEGRNLRMDFEAKLTQLESSRAELEELRDVDAQLRSELKTVQTALADKANLVERSHDRIKELENEVAVTEIKLVEAQQKIEDLREQLKDTHDEDQHHHCRGEIEILRAEKLSLLNELQATTSRLQTELKAEGGKKGRLERVLEELSQSKVTIGQLQSQLALQTQLCASLKNEVQKAAPKDVIGRGAIQLLCNSLSGLANASDRYSALQERSEILSKSLADLQSNNGRISPETREICLSVAGLLRECAQAHRERSLLKLEIGKERRRASLSDERAETLGKSHHASVVALGKLQKKTRQLEAAQEEKEMELKPRSLTYSASFTPSSSRPSLDRLLLRAASSDSCTTTIVLHSPPLPSEALTSQTSPSESGSSHQSEADSGHHGWSSIEVGADDSGVSSPPPPLSASPSLGSEGDAHSSSSASNSPPLPPPPKEVRLARSQYRPPIPPKPKGLKPPSLGATEARLTSALSKGTHFLLEWELPASRSDVVGYKVWLGGDVYKWLPNPESSSALLERAALFNTRGGLKELKVETALVDGVAPMAQCPVSTARLSALETSFNASKTSLLAQFEIRH